MEAVKSMLSKESQEDLYFRVKDGRLLMEERKDVSDPLSRPGKR